jgi:predicted transcriptional regulator
MDERRGANSNGNPDRHALAAAFRENFADISYVWDLFFVDVLLHLRRASLDDMDVLLIVAVMGMEEKRRRQVAQEAEADALLSAPPRGQMNASRLADVTGIPRETVRRKLRIMERAGLVDIAPGGSVSFRPTDAAGLAVQARYAAAREKVIDGAAAFAEVLVRKASQLP